GPREWGSRDCWPGWWPSGCAASRARPWRTWMPRPSPHPTPRRRRGASPATAATRARVGRRCGAGCAGWTCSAARSARAWPGAPAAGADVGQRRAPAGAAGAAVALWARTAPGAWPRGEWPGRLISRLQGGLTARIDPPGVAARRRYVLHRAGRHGLTLPAEAVERIAATADGYRTLDGWLARLALEDRLGPKRPGAGAEARALDAATVAAILDQGTALAGSAGSIESIARAVAARFGVRLGLLRGPSRRASVVAARHLAMHLARTLTGSSFATIGAYFGDRDPATVRHACRA